MSRSERVENAIKELDQGLEGKLRNNNLIGTVVADTPYSEKHFIRPRTVNFSWQRGVKIGMFVNKLLCGCFIF